MQSHLTWHQTIVGGRRAFYGAGGSGPPLVFAHGWALGSRAYKRAMKRLVAAGWHVLAPALPEFGGTAGLPSSARDLQGYAHWLRQFVEAAGIEGPVSLAGHSLGGAVCVQFAHDFPEDVAHLYLINAVGGAVWRSLPAREYHIQERPLLDWGISFTRDFVSPPGRLPMIRSVLEDAVPNFVRNPGGMWRTGNLARHADLTAELAAVAAAGVPATVIASEGDVVVPRASFDAICRLLGVEGHVVAGGHSWLLGDPDAFARIIGPPEGVQVPRPLQRAAG